MKVKSFHGEEIRELIPELAKLRIEVFRDFPYLYEGSLDYEKEYLKNYPENPRSVLVAAFDANEDLVGASTGMPLAAEADYVQAPFIKAGYNVNEIFYFAESVLLKAFRGMGLGHRFFEAREETARKFGYKIAAFCAVIRPDDHPDKPASFHPLDEFWEKRGFTKHSELQSEFSWPDIGDSGESKKRMVYWLKNLE
jgi:GNAT superfamily N-acetyltransferase